MELYEPFSTVLGDQQSLRNKTVLEDAQRYATVLDELNAEKTAIENALQNYYLAVDEQGWAKIGLDRPTDDFDRRNLREIISFAKMMYLYNPMIKRPVEVQKLYVWALGYTVTGSDPVLVEFISNFLKSRHNSVEFSHAGLKEKEGELQYTGNIFLVFFPNKDTGEVRVRSIDVNEIEEIYTNPDDPREPWFYKRIIKAKARELKDKVVWHPDWRYNPLDRKPIPRDEYDSRNEEWTYDWDHPVFHIKTGGTANMRFGFPEIFSALNWAKALKRFYENWSTIQDSYARIAMQMVRADKPGLPASKAKLGLAVNNSSSAANPPRLIGESGPPVGQWMMQSGGIKLEAVKTAGATTGTEEGRGLAKMIAAGVGLPLTFFGDLDHGSEATATTLDRPTELRMVDRQTQWNEWMVQIFQFAMRWSAAAPNGVLRKKGWLVETIRNRVDGVYEYNLVPPRGSTMPQVAITFPDILERNATERVRALIMGVTLMGKPITSVIPDRKYVTRKLLEAIGEDADIIERLIGEWDKAGIFADNEDMDAINPAPEPVLGPGGQDLPEGQPAPPAEA